MSTIGSAESYIEVKGDISIPDIIHGKSAYEVALMNGFKGTEAEWVEWLRNGVDGKDGNPGVYVGTGEMPEGYSVQIDPSGNDTAVFSEIAQTTGNSESAVMSQKATTDAIRTSEAIAKGRSSGYVFDTVSDMELWCSQSFPFVEYYSRSPYLGALEGPKVAIVVPDSDFYVPYGDWNVTEPICYVVSTRKFYNTTYDDEWNAVLVEMPEQPKAWQYTLIEVVDPPRLGDNLYIRDTGVPDYWWDGSEAKPMKADVDYAVKNGAGGIVKVNTNNNIVLNEKNELVIQPKAKYGSDRLLVAPVNSLNVEWREATYKPIAHNIAKFAFGGHLQTNTPRDNEGLDCVNKDYVDGLVGNIETALDGIIAMQNSLIGGESV